MGSQYERVKNSVDIKLIRRLPLDWQETDNASVKSLTVGHSEHSGMYVYINLILVEFKTFIISESEIESSIWCEK